MNEIQKHYADNIDFYTGLHDDKIIEKLLTDYKFFMETFLMIKTKSKKLIPFVLNRIQNDLYNRMHGKKYFYAMILKARQMGCSTFILGYFFVDTILNPNTNSVCVAHEIESASKLFDIIHLFYNNLPDILKPPRKYSNRKELFFSDRNNPDKSLESRFFVGSAGGRGFGRSATIQNLHLSEYAFYENPDEFLTGIIDAVPLMNSRIIIESTANGLNHFYEEYKEAVEKKNSLYEPIFYPWYMHDEYQLEVSDEEKKNWEFLDEEERYLFEKKKLTYEQLKFRRIRISLYKTDGANKFKQEYPSDWQEAFLAQTKYKWGFEPATIKKYLKNTKPPVNIKSHLLYKYPEIKLWEDVKDNKGYIVACDVAEGSETGHLSAIEIFTVNENQKLQQVGEYSGHLDLMTFSKVIKDVALYFNNAFILVERNNQGYAVVNNLFHVFGYPFIYKNDNKEGIYMTKKVKQRGLDNLIYLLNSDNIIIYSEPLIKELQVYASQSKSKRKQKVDNEIGHFDKLSALLLITSAYPEILQYCRPNLIEEENAMEYLEIPRPKSILV